MDEPHVGDLIWSWIQGVDEDKDKVRELFVNVTKEWNKDYERGLALESTKAAHQHVINPLHDIPLMRLFHG